MPRLGRLTRYLAVSYDDDQQQTFYDLVAATDAEAAKGIVARARDYAVAIDAWTLKQWRAQAQFLSPAHPLARIPKTALELRRNSEEIDDAEWCKRCDMPADECMNTDHDPKEEKANAKA